MHGAYMINWFYIIWQKISRLRVGLVKRINIFTAQIDQATSLVQTFAGINFRGRHWPKLDFGGVNIRGVRKNRSNFTDLHANFFSVCFYHIFPGNLKRTIARLWTFVNVQKKIAKSWKFLIAKVYTEKYSTRQLHSFYAGPGLLNVRPIFTVRPIRTVRTVCNGVESKPVSLCVIRIDISPHNVHTRTQQTFEREYVQHCTLSTRARRVHRSDTWPLHH